MAASVAILGGGISGLSTAYYLVKYGKNLINKILLLESAGRLGGWVLTNKLADGAIYELGPRSVRVAGNSGMNILAMVEDLEMESELIPIKAGHPATKNRFLLVDDRLHLLPSGGLLTVFRKVEPFRRPLFFYALHDLLKRRKVLEDDSMYDFAERRFGREIADLVMDPLCRGVFAGDSKRISVRALLNDAFEAEQEHGSVIKGLFKGFRAKIEKKANVDFSLGETARKERWAMWNLNGGLESLIKALATRLNDEGVEVRTATACKELSNETDSIRIETTDGNKFNCDHVFAAVPAFELANVVRANHAGLSKHLEGIRAVTVAVASLEYEGSPSKLRIQPAFGFLVPFSQNPGLLGVIYDSCSFPEHDAKNVSRTRLTAMMGGSWFEDQFGDPNKCDKAILLQYAIDSVSRYLKLAARPIRSVINIHENCIPQYEVGHNEKVRHIRDSIRNEKLSLSLVGSSYDGVGISDCVANAKSQVKEFLEKLDQRK